MSRYFLIAGEASGDRLGGALMEGLKHLDPDASFDGVGGGAMQAQGLTSRFGMDELSVMGLAEVLPKYRQLSRRIRETARAVVETKPDVLITIDSPDFCLRVARQARVHLPALPTVHYVAPSVWAWRPHRAEKMARHIDHVLALLPFEPPYMEAAGMSCDFVGHPVVSEPRATDAEIAAFRAAHDVPPGTPLVMVLPGSRRGEVGRLTPIFGEALRAVAARRPDLRVVVPTTDSVAGAVAEGIVNWPGRPTLLDPRGRAIGDSAAEKRAGFAAADAAIAASGTVSLELAAARTPMVIAYDMNWFSRQIIARMLKIDTVTLVNLVSETRAVPEFLGEACKPDAIAAALLDVLDAPDRQEQAMEVTMQRLGEGGEAPGLRAARSVLDCLGQ